MDGTKFEQGCNSQETVYNDASIYGAELTHGHSMDHFNDYLRHAADIMPEYLGKNFER